MAPMRCYLGREHGRDGWHVAFMAADGQRSVGVVNGQVYYDRVPEGHYAPDTLFLNHFEFQALRDELVKNYDPPTESKALRESLAIERARVDKLIERALHD